MRKKSLKKYATILLLGLLFTVLVSAAFMLISYKVTGNTYIAITFALTGPVACFPLVGCLMFDDEMQKRFNI